MLKRPTHSNNNSGMGLPRERLQQYEHNSCVVEEHTAGDLDFRRVLFTWFPCLTVSLEKTCSLGVTCVDVGTRAVCT